MMHSKTDINPFMDIIPRKNEEMFGRKAFYEDLKAGAEKALNGEKILVIEGGYGVGKSIIVEKLEKLLEKNHVDVINLNVAGDILDQVRRLPLEKKRDIFVVVDKFDLVESFKDKKIDKLLDLVEELSGKGLTFLIMTTKNGLEKSRKVSNDFASKLLVFHLPMLDYQHAKEMIIERLKNTGNKANSIAPFTDEELREIWKKSRGNPRMMLMLCASFYEQKR